MHQLQTLGFPVSPSYRSSANADLMFYCWETADVHSLTHVSSLELLQQQNYLNNISYKHVDIFLMFLLNPSVKVHLSILKDKMRGAQLLKII